MIFNSPPHALVMEGGGWAVGGYALGAAQEPRGQQQHREEEKAAGAAAEKKGAGAGAGGGMKFRVRARAPHGVGALLLIGGAAVVGAAVLAWRRSRHGNKGGSVDQPDRRLPAYISHLFRAALKFVNFYKNEYKMGCIVSWALELKRTACLGSILCRKVEGLDGGIVEDGKVRSHLSHSLMESESLHAKKKNRFEFVGSGWLIGAEA